MVSLMIKLGDCRWQKNQVFTFPAMGKHSVGARNGNKKDAPWKDQVSYPTIPNNMNDDDI